MNYQNCRMRCPDKILSERLIIKIRRIKILRTLSTPTGTVKSMCWAHKLGNKIYIGFPQPQLSFDDKTFAINNKWNSKVIILIKK